MSVTMEHPLVTILLFLIIGPMAYGSWLAAPWVPTLSKQRKLLVDNLTLSPTSIIYDLGCGSGSILFEFAHRYPDAQCIGYDVALFPLCLGWLTKLRHPKRFKNVHLKFGNLFKKHFGNADLVVAFLMAKAYPKFIATLSRELKPSATVVIEAWPFPTIEPTEIIRGDKLLPWYVYKNAKEKLET